MEVNNDVCHGVCPCAVFYCVCCYVHDSLCVWNCVYYCGGCAPLSACLHVYHSVCVTVCVCHTTAVRLRITVCVNVCTEGVNYGPLHSPQGVELFKQAVADAVAQGGKIECGGKVMCVCVQC